jgi:MerR family mercuric resistance operon transcriptional regulator
MKIGNLARAGGVNVETVRYYQRRGLMAEPPRGNGARRYATADLERLRSIRAAQTAGFTLDEIGQLFALDTAQRDVVQRLALSRIAALDERIATLQQMREALTRLAVSCAADEDAPCPIITTFIPLTGDAAGRRVG